MKHAPKKAKWEEKTKMVRSHVCIFLRGETKTKKGARRWLEHECTWLYPQHHGWMGRQREPQPEGMEKMTLPSDWPPGDWQQSRMGSRGACRTQSQTGGRTFVPGHQLTRNKTEARSWGFRQHWPVPQRERLTNVDRVSWPHVPRVMAGTGKTMRMQGGSPPECGPEALSDWKEERQLRLLQLILRMHWKVIWPLSTLLLSL